MGTSSSSSGPGSGVPFDPPWLNSIPTELSAPLEQLADEDPEINQNQPPTNSETQTLELAPIRRFGSARFYLGDFIKGGNRDSLKKALGHYSRAGMGGATKIASRMRTSASVGAGLYNFFQGVRDSSDSKIRDWVSQLTSKNLTAYEIADEIIDQVISFGGSLDEESCRNSMAQAISDLLAFRRDIDLMKLDDNNIWTIVELFIAYEAFNRLYLDIGQTFESSKFTPRQAVTRMNEMKEYLKSEISVQIQLLRTDKISITKSEINSLLQSALKATFAVFEEAI